LCLKPLLINVKPRKIPGKNFGDLNETNGRKISPNDKRKHRFYYDRARAYN
jgi:hypothetical protein